MESLSFERASEVQEPEPGRLYTENDYARARALLQDAEADLVRSDYAGARERAGRAIDSLFAVEESNRGDDWLQLLNRAGLAASAGQDPASAVRAFEHVLEVRSRTLPDGDPDLQWARMNLAVTIKALGDLPRARELEEAALKSYSRTRSSDDHELQMARGNLARTLKAQGDLHGARILEEAVLDVFSRTLPEDHSLLQMARGNLAATMHVLGDLDRARVLEEDVLRVFARTLPEDHPHLQVARGNLATTLFTMGDLHGARALFEVVRDVYAHVLPADHPQVYRVMESLAATMHALGDIGGARALVEEVLEVRVHTLPADHPELHTARQNMALSLKAMGELSDARALEEDVLEGRTRTLPADHPDIQDARLNLALTLRGLGDLHAARVHEEAVLEVRLRTLPADHPGIRAARQNLAGTKHLSGDLQGALELEELALETCTRTLPDYHVDFQLVRTNLAWTLARLAANAARSEERQTEGVGRGRSEDGVVGWTRALALVGDAVHCAHRATQAALSTASVREAEERVVRGDGRPLGFALSFAVGLHPLEPMPGLLARAFELSEATRAVGLAGAALARAEIEPAARERLREELRAAGEELAALAQRGATREEYHRARVRRETAERELLLLARSHAREGLGVLDVGVEALAEVLGAGRALVGFRRYERWSLEEAQAPGGTGGAWYESRSSASLGAFVLRAEDGEPHLAFVDLGAIAEVEDAVLAWRGAIGVGGGGVLDRSGGAGADERRGIGLSDGPSGSGLAEGARVRRLVWDPLAEALGDARHVVVALDDVLHLVPLDVLPLEEGGESLGERWRIEPRVALWELLDPPRPPSERAALVSLGGAAFDAPPRGLGQEGPEVRGTATDDEQPGVNASSIALLRGGAWERGFAPLAHTRSEARGLVELFEQAFGGSVEGVAPALLLERAHASRAALVEAAPRARYLHVATHGWFAPESVRSWADRDDSSQAGGPVQRLGGEDTVRGMSPMLLCGLALAGANLPPDAIGRVPGLMTAEELSTLDLTGCELAVLSACDTNVGERRAGQGVASLQKALHMAGARSVITSLWKVPDGATAELMLDFYRRLWVEKLPKHQALWEAKLRLREAKDEQGRPLYTVRDWAAWVLTGDPE